MLLSDVISKLTPPVAPQEVEQQDWNAIEEQFGLRMPNDYKHWVAAYGTGVIGEFLWVLNPFSQNRSLNGDASRYFQTAYATLRAEFPIYYPRPPLPEMGAFFTWAVTDNGDSIVWVIESDDPNDWRVGIQASDPSEEELTSYTTTAFLNAILDRSLKSQILPDGFLTGDMNFRSVPYTRD